VFSDDPEFGVMKASYREHIGGASRFKEVVPINDEMTRAKIHQTYRLKYLKDVVLARILDDPTFSVLNSYIYFNEVDIVIALRDDKTFLTELFAIFPNPPSEPVIGPQLPSKEDSAAESSFEPTEQQRDGVFFLQQFCSMAKNLQPQHRVAFYRSLAERGLLRVVEFALSLDDDPAVRNAGIDLLMIIIDHDPGSVRKYCQRQHEAGTRALLVFLIDIFHTDPDLGLKAQLAEALRVLVQYGPEGLTAEVRCCSFFLSLLLGSSLFRPTLGVCSCSCGRPGCRKVSDLLL
jgi:protein phosphatase-4 regulatory subunit 3